MYVHLRGKARAAIPARHSLETPPCATPLPPLVLPLPPSVPTPPAPSSRARPWLVPHGVGRLRGHRAVRRHARPQPRTTAAGAQPGQVARALQHRYLGVPLETSVNGYLVNTGSKLVLIDTGAASLFGPTLGRLLANLKASGYGPEQVDEIYITHLHGDHISGATAEGKTVFPNAVLRVDQRDADFWLSRSRDGQGAGLGQGLLPGRHGLRQAVQGRRPLQALRRQQGRRRARARRQGLPHLRPHARPQRLRGPKRRAEDGVLGRFDARCCGAVPDPSITIAFDSDPKSAAPSARLPMPLRRLEGTTPPPPTSPSPASASCAPMARAMSGSR